jgi:multidrug efflux pump subunit AcrB
MIAIPLTLLEIMLTLGGILIRNSLVLINFIDEAIKSGMAFAFEF